MPRRSAIIFICSNCDAQFQKWNGRCFECGKWGTLKEVHKEVADGARDEKEKEKTLEVSAGGLVDFSDVKGTEQARLATGIEELDRVLGGGIVQGSLVLLGGDPGIGKSTLVLQIANEISKQAGGEKVTLYVSGEESASQVKLRYERLGQGGAGLRYLGETSLNSIIGAIIKHKPIFAVVDSIQTIHTKDVESEAGSVAQIRACTVQLLECAKKYNVPIFLVGHVTKEGAIAGPKMLEHLVDVVLYLEGDDYHIYRMLRSVKNRFGTIHEIGVFEMREEGMACVKNPSKLFLDNETILASGSSVTVVMEGVRPFLVEIQALVSKTNFGYPKRTASGFDLNRLQLLIAILQKRAGIDLGMHDVYVNVVGGYKVKDPSVDLAVAAALYSAYKDIEFGKAVFIGEVGLGGEVRPVPHIKNRVKEAKKLGFKKIIVPAHVKDEAEGAIGIKQIKDLATAHLSI